MNYFYSFFNSAEKRYSGNLCLVDWDNTTWTYAQLEYSSEVISQHLLAEGVNPGDIVGISAIKSRWYIASVLACFRIGASYIPISRDNYPSVASCTELSTMLCFGKEPTVEVKAKQIKVDQLSLLPEREIPSRINTKPDDIAYILYTSGSTGKPKGVPVTHQGLINLVESQYELFALEPGTRVLHQATPTFDASVWEIFFALAYGHTLYIAKTNIDGYYLSRMLKQHRIELMSIVPSLLRLVPRELYPHLKVLVVGGEVMPHYLRSFWRAGRRLINSYGPTECSVCVSNAEDTGQKMLPLGQPIRDTQVLLVDESNNEIIGAGGGELLVSGPGVVPNYYNKPCHLIELPNRDGLFYRTGDRVERNIDGELLFIGRIDFQVKIAGERIDLEFVERRIAQYSGISQVLVEYEQSHSPPSLVAYASVTADFDEQGFWSFVRAELPSKSLPRKLIQVDEFELTANGKIKRTAHHEPQYQSGSSDSTVKEFIQLCNDIVLDDVSGNSNLFELGIDSLDMVDLVCESKVRLGIDIKLCDIWSLKTPNRIFEYSRCHKGSVKFLKSTDKLSATEESLVIASLFEPSSWNEGIVIEFGPDSSRDIICYAIQELMICEPSLSSVFPIHKDGIKKEKGEFRADDLIEVYPTVEQAYTRAVECMTQTADLGNGPLLKWVVAPTSVYFIAHHILLDGLSLSGVLLPKLWMAYHQARKNIALSTISEFVAKSANIYNLEAVGEDINNVELESYLEQSYSGLLETHIHNSHSPQLSARIHVELDTADLPIQGRVTDFVYFLSCWQKSLSLTLKHNRITVGTAMRPYKLTTESLPCGYYLNTLLLPSPDLSENIDEIILHNAKNIERNLEFSMFPYHTIQKKIREKNLSCKSSKSLFSVINVEPELLSTEEMLVSHIWSPKKTPKYPITLHLESQKARYVGWIEIDYRYISPLQAEQIQSDFLNIALGTKLPCMNLI
ncbi:AMP-binding protein [uncultured Vibrio sp.]|uniref:AMP-binding protein n=1 Tax=uncultured Vibrio sp. TaxID=114054 RepID=UPI002601FEED|nr:AMP-binding protein [uncultured Vibrio sp.]